MSGSSGRGIAIAVVATMLLWFVAAAGAGVFWWLSQDRGISPIAVLQAAPDPGPGQPGPLPPDLPSGPLPSVPPVPQAGGTLSRASVAPTQGHLDELLRAHLLATEASGRRLLVFFTASRCAPCQAVRQTLAAADIGAQLADAQLVEVDVDAFTGLEMHRTEALLLDQEVDAIPLVCALRRRQPPVCIDGGAWGEDSDANIRAVLLPFMLEPPSGTAPRAPDRITPI